MGFKSRSKNKKTNSNSKEKGESVYRNLGGVMESKERPGNQYIKINDFYGDLIFQDKKTKKFFKVKTISLFDPKDAPDYVLANLVVNIENENQVELVGEDTSDEDQTSDDSEVPNERDQYEDEERA